MDNLQYNYVGKSWTPCPTETEGNCFFNSVFGTRNSEDQPYRDKHEKFRRQYWANFLTYYSDGHLPGTLLEHLQKCFLANDRYKHKSVENLDNYADYIQDITTSDYLVLPEDIPLLAALENIRIVLFTDDRDRFELFEPDLEILGTYPFRSTNSVREVVITLVHNRFFRLEPHDQSNEIKCINGALTQTGNSGRCRSIITRKKRYKKRGSAGIKGTLYQINVLTIVLLNALAKVQNWRLSTEDEDAGKFDDLIFEFLPSESAILLQAKHKENENKRVTYEDLVSVNPKNEFSLPKYFFSYQDIIRRNKFKVQNIIICTNLGLDQSAKRYLKEEIADEESVLHLEGIDNGFYSFIGDSLPLLKENIKKYYENNVQNKKILITDETISEFLSHLRIFPQYICKKNLDEVIERTISKVALSVNLDTEKIFENIHKKMLDWFKEEEGRYLSEIEANGFFCDIRSNKYCDTLKYDISFKNNNMSFIFQNEPRRGSKGKQRQQKIDYMKRLFHILPNEELMLNVIKIYQALKLDKTKPLFVNPDEPIHIQRQIINAFEVDHYTHLVIVCHKSIEEDAVAVMCDKVVQILKECKYKFVILIAKEGINFFGPLQNLDDYQAIADRVRFSDLELSTQEKLKQKRKIHFQGNIMSLEELFRPSTDDVLNRYISSKIIVTLARNVEIRVGSTLRHRNKYYIYRTFKRSGCNISEENMFRLDDISKEKAVLISDSAGMGKSTVLTSLAITIKEHNPHLWVARVDLNNYTNTMNEFFSKGAVSVVDILESQELKSEFEKKLFLNEARVVLLLDGVDEVCPKYTDLIKNLLKVSLSQPNLAKIIVTTRPHLCWELAKVLNAQPLTLEPFSTENQIDFLTNYWTEELHLKDDIEKKKCTKYVKALIQEISKWIDDKPGNTFAGIPLQTRMLAEVFQEESRNWKGCKEFLSSDDAEPKLPDRVNLIRLYEMFIEKKRDIFINDKSNPGRGGTAEAALKDKFEECHDYHRSLAIELIFDSKSWKLFTCYKDLDHSSPFVDQYLLGAGIIQSQGGTLHFIHRTFAEYFAAESLVIELRSNEVNVAWYELLRHVLKSDLEYGVVRSFFDSLIKAEPQSVKNKIFKYYSDNTSLTPRKLMYRIALSGCVEILSCFIEYDEMVKTEKSDSSLNKYANITDADYDRAYKIATLGGYLKIIDMKSDDDIYGLKQTYADLSLSTATERGHLDIIQFLVAKSGADVNTRIIYDESLLEIACKFGHLNVVKYFAEKHAEYLAERNEVDLISKRALHAAILGGQPDIVRFFVEDRQVDITDLRISSEMILNEVELKENHMPDKDNDLPERIPAEMTRDYLEVVRYMVNRNCQLTLALEVLEKKLTNLAA